MKRTAASLLALSLTLSAVQPFAALAQENTPVLEEAGTEEKVIDFTEGYIALEVNSFAALSPVVNAQGEFTVTFASSDPATVYVNDGGEVKAEKAGSATITATLTMKDTGQTYTADITVHAYTLPEAVSFEKEEITLEAGKTQVLSPVFIGGEGAYPKTWTSSDEDVAYVNDAGEVLAVSAGTATITLSVAEGISATVTVNVEQPAIAFEDYEITAVVDEQISLTPVIADAYKGKDLIWTSSDPQIVTVNDGGDIAANKPGTATITVQIGEDGPEASVDIIVVPVIDFVLNTITMNLGTHGAAAFVVSGYEGDAYTLDFKSSDESVVMVNDMGDLAADKEGTATITCTLTVKETGKTYTAQAEVTVIKPWISLEDEQVYAVQDEVFTLIPDVNAADLTVDSLVWTSSDPETVSVDKSGKITALKPGTATVTVAIDGLNVSDSVEVIVAPVIDFEMGTITLNANDRENSNFVVSGYEAGTYTLDFTSSNTDVLLINDAGEMYALKKGEAIITGTLTDTATGKTYTATAEVTVLNPYINFEDTAIFAVEDETAKLSPQINAAGLTYDSLVWTSSDPETVSVDDEGNITALKPGTADITCTLNGTNVWDSVQIIVAPVVAFEFENPAVNVNDIYILDTVISGYDEDEYTLSYSSSDPKTVFVSSNGMIYGRQEGTATVTATVKVLATGKTYTATADVTVIKPFVNFEDTEIYVVEDQSAKLEPMVSVANAGAGLMIWSSSNPGVVSVDAEGNITAKGLGSATITVQLGANGAKDSVEVVVVPVVDFEIGTLALNVDDKYPLIPVISGYETGEYSLAFTSGDPEIVYVNDAGELAADKEGKTVITAFVTDLATGKVYTASCEVTVLTPAISFEDEAVFVNEGKTEKLIPLVHAAGITSDTLKWSSSDPETVSVDDQGNVTANKAGVATITVSLGENGVSASVEVAVVPVIAFVNETFALNVDDMYVLTPEITTDEENYTVTFASSDPEVLYVNDGGELKALKEGEAEITATLTAETGKTYTATATVTVLTPSISLSDPDTGIYVVEGSNGTLFAAVTGANLTTESVKWTSSDSGIVAVDNYGNITAKTPGMATITVTLTDHNLSDSVDVYVVPVAAFENESPYFNVGDKGTLVFDISGYDSDNYSLAFTSSNPEVLMVNDMGEIAADKEGTSTVTLTVTIKSTGKTYTATADVTVLTPSITIEDTDLYLNPEETYQIETMVNAANLTWDSLVWTSSNENVVSVDENGNITANKIGTATVTVTLKGTTVSDSVTVHVVNEEDPAFSSVVVTMDQYETKTLELVVPDAMADQTITWTSSNTEVARVTDKGVVIAENVGSAIITAEFENGTQTSVMVNVISTQPEIEAYRVYLEAGSSQQLTWKALVNNLPVVTSLTGTWLSSDPDIADVDEDGVVTATTDGVFTITFCLENGNTASVEGLSYIRQDIYRLYNPNSGEHVYTADAAEKDMLVKAGWKDEGIAWQAPSISNVPVYRLYNANAGDHMYTTSKEEVEMLVEAGWKDEGIVFYSDENGTTNLYRLYNPNAKAGAHHFTASKEENDFLKAQGWREEGFGWDAL